MTMSPQTALCLASQAGGGACGLSSVAQLDRDEETWLTHGM